jgi:hypothetical protein
MNIHVYPTSMSNFKKLSQLDLEIHKVGHQERLAVESVPDNAHFIHKDRR